MHNCSTYISTIVSQQDAFVKSIQYLMLLSWRKHLQERFTNITHWQQCEFPTNQRRKHRQYL